MKVAVITPAHGRHEHLRQQQSSLLRSRTPVAVRVVVGMDDPELAAVLAHVPGPPSTSVLVHAAPAANGLPLARARNLGAWAAVRAGADLLVFLDVDCVVGPDTVAAFVSAATDPATRDDLLTGAVGYLPCPPPDGYDLAALPEPRFHPARPRPEPGHSVRDADPALFWSLSFALRPATWEAIGGFDEAYEGYGAEDTDFGQRAARAGVSLTFVGGGETAHQWHPSSTPPAEHLDDLLRNAELFADRWGWWPMQGWFDELADRGLVTAGPGGVGWRRG